MKKYIFLFIVLFITININAQNVNIPDPNFKSFLLSSLQFNPNQDTEISITEANAFTGLMDCSGLNISDLTGVEAFVNMTELLCYNNNITALDVSALTSLTRLICGDNQLSSLNVNSNTNLERLSFGGTNQISSINVSNNTNLKGVAFHNQPISIIDLSNNPLIDDVQCTGSSITELDLSNNPSLINLFATNTQIDSLDVSSNINLQVLLVDSNQNLEYLNVKNGNNTAIFYYDSRVTPNLTCIEVDNVTWSNSNWTWRDANNVFNTSCSVGLAEFKEKTNLSIYPNPTNGYVTIQLDEIPKNVVINIKDVLGKTLLEQKANSTSTLINVSSLPEGIYYVELINDSYKYAKKLVVN